MQVPFHRRDVPWSAEEGLTWSVGAGAACTKS